ncbi:MAG TPA: metallophosphoesterase [Bauldia sp.]|nr:metallophosphoesterase [Bauldia sp.]
MPPPPLDRPARLPDGECIYAFGDLHGRDDLAARLGAAIAADMAVAPPAKVTVIGLGDLIDRGPDSHAVVARMVAGFPGTTTISLRGNHEQMMLDFLEDPQRNGQQWFRNGAPETLRSYGVETGGRERPPPEELARVRNAFARALPPAELVFLQRTPFSHSAGDYFFAHAGVRSGIALDDQEPTDLLWIRSSFADDDPPCEKVVVHGHTPIEQPFVGRFRINLDTGAVFTGQLTCLVLAGESRRLLPI